MPPAGETQSETDETAAPCARMRAATGSIDANAGDFGQGPVISAGHEAPSNHTLLHTVLGKPQTVKYPVNSYTKTPKSHYQAYFIKT
jgi:hypothetical protein